MEFRYVILSIACISCLIPSALSFNLVAAKAVASQAAQDIAVIKADTIAAKKAAVVKAASDITDIVASGLSLKGQALTTAASSIAGAIINGAASIGATLAKAGVDIVAAKFGIVRPSVVLKPSVVYQPPLQDPEPQGPYQEESEATATEESTHKPISSVFIDERSEYKPQQSADEVAIAPKRSKTHAKHTAPVFEVVGPAYQPFTYEIVETPQVFSSPLIQTFY